MHKGMLCWIFFITVSVSAQDVIHLHGKVVDRRSGQPLPYATIRVRDASVGTVSNLSGDFEFFVTTRLSDDTLLISYVGYKTLKTRIADVKSPATLYLDESPSILNEIVVTSDWAKALIEKAVESIPSVYANAPYLMEGFHRSWEKVDFTDSISYPGTLIEAAVTIYDPGYVEMKSGNKREEEVYINEVKRSAVNKGWSYSSSALSHLLKRNLVKYNEEPAWNFLKSFLTFPNNLEFELEGETYIEDEQVSIVHAKIPNNRKFPASAKIYISTDDHAILRFDLFGENEQIDFSVGPWHTQYLAETFIFSRYQHIPYLRYASLHYIIKNLDTKNKKVLRTEEYHRELLINNIIISEVAEKRKVLLPKKSKGTSLALQSGIYNESFWKTYNVIKENPLEREIAEYFERSRSLNHD